MDSLVAHTHRSMLGFLSKRAIICHGHHSVERKLFSSRTKSFCPTVSLLCQAGSENSTLGISIVGLGERNSERKSDKFHHSIKRKPSSKSGQSEVGTYLFSGSSFSDLSISPLLIERLEKENFVVPTDVQSTAIPIISQNQDVVIQSYTGSGKTLAYLLPILSKVGPLSHNGFKEHSETKPAIQAVIIAPSRELGMQIVRDVEKLLGPVHKRYVQQLVGGANRLRQEEALRKNKPGIVIGTPGRIAEISAAGKLHTHGCRFLILDEVDQLLAFNFREDMHRILEHVGQRPNSKHPSTLGPPSHVVDRQVIMVSATVPFSVIRAAKTWGRDPLLIKGKSVSSLNTSAPENSPSSLLTEAVNESLPPSLKHYYCVVKGQHKVDAVRRCVHALDAKFVVVFMNNSKQIKDVVHKLEARGMKVAELHGDLGKLARSTTMKKFKDGELRVLVTNELLARGLDVAECDLVLNIDLPTDSVHYAHRAGRAGRLGRNGHVVTICEDSEVFVVKKLQRQLGVAISPCEFSEGRLLVKEQTKKPEPVK